MTPVRLVLPGERRSSAAIANRPVVDILTGSGYGADGSDFEGFSKKIELNVLDYTPANGVADDSSGIIDALGVAAVLNGRKVLRFVPGRTYRIGNEVALSSAIKDLTVIAYGAKFIADGQSSGRLFNISGSASPYVSMTVDTAEGDTSATVADGTGFSAHDHVHVLDDSLVGADVNHHQENNILKSVVGGVLDFKYPVNFAYATGQSARLRRLTPVERVNWFGGDFDMTGTTGDTDAIQVGFAFNCKVADVTVRNWSGTGVQVWQSINVSVRNISGVRPTDVSAGRGYVTQLIFARHSKVVDAFGEDCRHTVDVTGGSDCEITGTRFVCDPAITPSSQVFTHGCHAKRIDIRNTQGTGSLQAIAIGNGAYDGDFDVSIDGFNLHRQNGDAIFVLQNSKGVSIANGRIKDAMVRAIAINAATDVDIENVRVNGILTNPSNFGAIDVGAGSDKVRVGNGVRIRNALHHAIRLQGSGDHTIEGVDIDHSGTGDAIGSTGLTGRIATRANKVVTRSAVSQIMMSGAAVEVLVEDNRCYGIGVQAVRSVYALGGPTALIIRKNRLANASELIRIENTIAPIVEDNTLDTGTTGIRLIAPVTRIFGLGTNRFLNIGNTTILVNTAGATVMDGFSPDRGDNAVTLVVGQDAQYQLFASPLSVARAVTLSTTGAYVGAFFEILRAATATGASALNVGSGPLKALAVGQGGRFTFNGTAWMLTSFWSL